MRKLPFISKFGLKTKLILSMVGVGTFPLFLGMFFSYSQANKSLQDVIGSNFQALAFETADKVDLMLQEEIARNIRIANLPIIVQYVEQHNKAYSGTGESLQANPFYKESLNWKQLKTTVHPILENQGSRALKTSMNELFKDTESTQAIFITDPKGVLISSINSYPEFFSPRLSLAGETMAESKVNLGGIFLDEKTNNYMFQLSVFLKNESGQTLGKLHRVYSAKKFFSPLLGSIHFGTTGHAMIIDSEGKVIDCPVLPTGHQLSNKTLVKKVTSPKPSWGQTQSDGHGNQDQSIIGFSPLIKTNSILQSSKGNPWHMFVWQASDELFAPTRNLLTWISSFGAFSALLLILLGIYASGQITKPIRKLKEATARIRRGDTMVEVPVESNGEIGELAESFNQMTRSLKETRRSEQSHLGQLKHAMANMEESEMRLRAIMDNVLDSIITIDGKGIIQTFNPATERIFGYQAAEVIGQSINRLMPEPDRSKHDEYMQNYLRTGVAKIIGFGREVSGLRKDGSVFPMELAVSEMQLEAGRQFIGIVRDLSERKQAEEELRKRTEEIKSLSKFPSENPSPVLRVRSDEIVFYANSPALDLLNDGNSGIGRLILPCFRQAISQAFESRSRREIDVKYKKQVFSFEIMPVADADYVNIYGRDITERNRAEEKLRNSREQLRNLSRELQSAQEEERSRISREIHDELGQALTALSLDLAWIKRSIPQAPKSVLNQIRSMTRFIDTTIERVQAIATELRPEILDVLGICDALKWHTDEFIKRTGIDCQLTWSPENIQLDPDRSTAFFRIYQEALTNVARHANASKVAIFFKQDQNLFKLEIKDNGKGIEEGQFSNPKSLGLIGINERSLLLGGTVQIQGSPEEGTTITVCIPREP